MASLVKQDILRKIREITQRDGVPPGLNKFRSETGIARHVWAGKIWRNWSDALTEAGFTPNSKTEAVVDDEMLAVVLNIANQLGRFPTSSDIEFEVRRRGASMSPRTILARWRMHELAEALAEYADRNNEPTVAALARLYQPKGKQPQPTGSMSEAIGYVYMQKHGPDYKIGYTTSLNKRGRQIQLELPREVELVHSILTDDPSGVEAYWHRRFAERRTRGEWFKLTRADVSAFKRWSKIW
ncbi:MAG: hypothetical protein Rhirs2KO_10890 [Rhizobiaceae bacterium]